MSAGNYIFFFFSPHTSQDKSETSRKFFFFFLTVFLQNFEFPFKFLEKEAEVEEEVLSVIGTQVVSHYEPLCLLFFILT